MNKVLLLICLLGCHSCFAQQAGIVASVSGKVYLQAHGKKTALQKGMKLDEGDNITVTRGGSATITCMAGGSVTLYTMKTYSVHDIAKCCHSPDPSLYAAILNDVAKGIYNNEEEENTSAGGINRHRDLVAECTDTLYRMLDSVNYCGGKFAIIWGSTFAPSAYKLKIFFDVEDRVPTIILPITSHSINLETLADTLKKPHIYYWTLTARGEQCGMHKLRIWSKPEFEALTAAYDKAVNDLIGNNAEREYTMGKLLERDHFFAEAHLHYKSAAHQAPANRLYTHALKEFETRYKIN